MVQISLLRWTEGGLMKAGSIRFSVFLMLFILILAGCASEAEKKQSHFKKGQAYFENGQYKEARLEFKNAIRIDPRYLEANIQLAKTEVEAGGYRKCLQSISAGG